MSLSRITNGFMLSQSVNFINNNQAILAKLQERISSGRNINTASDDPVGLTRILNLNNTLSADERYKRNIDAALTEVNTADTALSNVTSLVHRAKELAVQGANSTNSQAGLNAIALEIDELINQVVQIGNTNVGGKYIFGGMKTNVGPYSRAVDTVTFAGTPVAETYQRQAEISQGITLPYNLNGQNIFGDVTVAAGVVTGGSGLLHTLMSLRIDLANGNTAGVRTRLDTLDADLNTVSTQQSILGATMNRLELTQQRIDDRKINLTKQYAGIQDVDMAKTISDMNYQQNILQASLNVSARVLQSSIMDYLR
jgi:flagellar hook-associated protein 3 FlgL